MAPVDRASQLMAPQPEVAEIVLSGLTQESGHDAETMGAKGGVRGVGECAI